MNFVKRKYPVDTEHLLSSQVLNTVHFDIVHGCQLRCVGCPNSTLLPKVQRISVGDFDCCLRNIDVEHIHRLALFNYGEPLLHDKLPAILKRISEQSWSVDRVEISTNAQNIDWTMLEEAVKMRILTHFAISCDGDGSPADYEKLRPPAKWSKLIECFKRLSELRDLHHQDLQIFTRSIVTTKEGCIRWENTLSPFGITPEFRRWLALPDAKENNTNRAFAPGKGVCVFQQGNSQLYVAASGDVVPCCAHPNAGILGNLHQHKFSEISRSNARRDFLQQLRVNRKNMTVCGHCEFGTDPLPDPFQI
jgi:radical SAM protein with 4Fe4S-binding SPASM domain